MTTPHHHHHRGRHPRINRPPRPQHPRSFVASSSRVRTPRVCVQPMFRILSVFTFSSLPLAFVSIFPLFFFFRRFRLFPSFFLFLSSRSPSEGRHLVFGLKSEKSLRDNRLREKEIVSRKLSWNENENWMKIRLKCTRKGSNL